MPHDTPALRDLAVRAADTEINELVRGFPPGQPAIALHDVGALRWSIPAEDVCLPVLTVGEAAFDHNIAVINDYAAEHGLKICAHGKTMMAPQLLARVLRGRQTLGLCGATSQQAAVMAACGAPNVLIANQIIGRANIAKLGDLARRYAQTRFLVFVDSIAGADQLLAHMAGAPLSVLVEIGVPGGRGGVRDVATARQLIAHMLQLAPVSGLRLAGVASYEGAVPAGPEQQRQIAALFDLTAEVYEAALELGMPHSPKPIISAGGSSSFDLVASALATRSYSAQPDIWLRPGVAPTYDHVVYQERLAEMDQRQGFVLGGQVQSAQAIFRPALALWAAVQSIPDGDVALVAAGIRDFPADAGYPTLLEIYRQGSLAGQFAPGTHQMSRANDQHGFLPLTVGLDVRIGDVLKFGISHPCTAFDKWPVLFMIDAGNVVTEAIRTYF
jgi:D-serine dehydratase